MVHDMRPESEIKASNYSRNVQNESNYFQIKQILPNLGNSNIFEQNLLIWSARFQDPKFSTI